MTTLDYDIDFRSLDCGQTFPAQCTSLTGSTISFISEQAVDTGKGLEVHLQTNNPANPCLTAYVETLKTRKTTDQRYEISAAIKIIKGN